MPISLKELIRAEEGATALEYGLLAALIAAGIMTAVLALGNQVNSAFTTVATAIGSATGS